MNQEALTLEVQTPEMESPSTDISPLENPEEEPAILDELVIEEVNIDGMCGVY